MMESDMGNPIEYNPDIDPLNNQEENENSVQEPQQQYYMHPAMYVPQQEKESVDLFKNVDKSTWIIAFAVFLLGFFMGKTMQPVILRYA
jgi:heme-binding NEAT domain protein